MYLEAKIVSGARSASSYQTRPFEKWRKMARDWEEMHGSDYFNRKDFSIRL